MSELKLTDVAKSYGPVDVLKHIDLDIERGELPDEVLVLGLADLDVRLDHHRLTDELGAGVLLARGVLEHPRDPEHLLRALRPRRLLVVLPLPTAGLGR